MAESYNFPQATKFPRIKRALNSHVNCNNKKYQYSDAECINSTADCY